MSRDECTPQTCCTWKARYVPARRAGFEIAQGLLPLEKCTYHTIKAEAQNKVNVKWQHLKAVLKQRGEKFIASGAEATCAITAIEVKCPTDPPHWQRVTEKSKSVCTLP